MKKKIIAYVVSAVMVLTMIPATAFAATDADGSGMSKTAPDDLTKAQETAIAALEAVDLLDYDSEGAASVQSIIDQYIASIEASTTAAEVNAYKAAATTEISAVDDAMDIINAYYPAKPDGSGNYTASDYTQSTTEIAELRQVAEDAIGDATTNEEVDVAIAAYKAGFDAIPIDTEKASSELQEYKEEKIEELEGYVDVYAYPGAEYNEPIKSEINAEITIGTAYINAATTTTGVDSALSDAKGEIEALVDESKTTDMLAYEEALADAVVNGPRADGSYQYANTALYSGDYLVDIQEILENAVGDRKYSNGYFFGLGNYVSIAYFNEYMKNGTLGYSNRDYEAPTVENVNAIVEEIKADIALIPTTANNETVVNNWTAAVGNVSATTGTYDELKALVDQYNAFNTTDKEKVATAYATLQTKLAAYDARQASAVAALIAQVPETVDGDNYITTRDLIEDIETEAAKYFDTEIDITAATNLKDDVEDVEDLIGAFIDKVYNSGKYIIPDAEELAKADFEWDYQTGDEVNDVDNMTAAEKAYGKITDTMKNDPDADTYDPKDITLAKAIEVYETAAASLAESDAAIDNVEALIGQLPLVVSISDKTEIDAATAAYNALTPNQQQYGVASTLVTHLQSAQSIIITDYVEVATAAATAVGITTGSSDWNKLTADLIEAYNEIGEMAKTYGHEDTENPLAESALGQAIAAYDNNAAASVEAIINGISNDPDEATEEDLAAVQQARDAYEALLTQGAKDKFVADGYLRWLEKYEDALEPILAAKDLANATVTILGPFIDGGLPYIARGTTPEVEVTDANGDVIPESAYTVDCNEAHPAGKTSLIIRANDGSGYTGENEAAYVVVNNKKSIKSLKGAKKSFTVKYSDYSKHGCTGTEIAWKTSKNGEWKFSKITSNKASKKITVKKAGKKYVKVRAIVKVDGIRYYSDWSKTKTVTVK